MNERCNRCRDEWAVCEWCEQRINTAMTMPDRIWVDETSEDEEGFIYGRYDRKYINVDQCYIRADIADELARALDGVVEVMRMIDGKPVCRMTDVEKALMMVDRAALARYRQSTAD